MRALSTTARLAGTALVLVLALLTAAFAATGHLPLASPHTTRMPSVDTSDLRGPIVRAAASQTLLTAANLQPGTVRVAQLRITNTGTTRGVYTFTPASLTDSATAGPERLSGVLDLLMQDATNRFAPITLFHGPLASITPIVLGALDPGQARTYRFTVRYPTGRANAADDALQGAASSVVFNWDASFEDTPPATPPAAPGTQTPAPAPTAPAARTTTTASPDVSASQAPASRPVSAPAARLRVVWLTAREGRRGVRVRVTCRAACAGRLTGSVSLGNGGPRRTLTARRIHQAAGRTRTYVLGLDDASAAGASRVYRRGGRATARVRLTTDRRETVVSRAVLRRPTFGGTMAP